MTDQTVPTAPAENPSGDAPRCRRDRVIDILLLVCAALPMIAAMTLKVLFTPASEGIEINGALVFFTIPMPFQDLPISEAQVNSWAVILSIFFLCLFLTRGLTPRGHSVRQIVVETIVEMTDKLVWTNMGPMFAGFPPFIAAVMALSAFSSLSSLLGLFPPTSDVNVVGGWAILVFILITHYKLKGGVGNYLKGFTEPMALMTPLNVVSEFATPVSMTFRQFGNVLSGVVISALLSSALSGLSRVVLGWIPVIGQFPWLQIGIPAVLSVYFDVFSGLMQAFIFGMLTMVFVSAGFPEEQYLARLEKKAAREKHRRDRS